MRAWVVHQHGAPADVLHLEEVPEPEPGPDRIRIRVAAAALNLPDDRLCRGTYQLKPDLPFTPGLEAAGVVDAVGPGAERWLGRRVVMVPKLPCGALCDVTVGLATNCWALPDTMTDVDAVAMLVAFQTGHLSLHRRARLQAGETLLVHAGAGGVGSAAIQLGRLAGAATVLATAGGPAKVALCRDLGAHDAFDTTTGDFVDWVRERTGGRGADVVFDPVGGPVFHRSRRCVASEGRILVIGVASGDLTDAPLNHALLKNYSIVGFYAGAYTFGDPAAIDRAQEDIVRWHAEGRIRPVIGRTVALDGDVPGAITDLAERRTTGKVVVLP
jgi:NADPH2:quinone reductase